MDTYLPWLILGTMPIIIILVVWLSLKALYRSAETRAPERLDASTFIVSYTALYRRFLGFIIIMTLLIIGIDAIFKAMHQQNIWLAFRPLSVTAILWSSWLINSVIIIADEIKMIKCLPFSKYELFRWSDLANYSKKKQQHIFTFFDGRVLKVPTFMIGAKDLAEIAAKKFPQ